MIGISYTYLISRGELAKTAASHATQTLITSNIFCVCIWPNARLESLPDWGIHRLVPRPDRRIYSLPARLVSAEKCAQGPRLDYCPIAPIELKTRLELISPIGHARLMPD